MITVLPRGGLCNRMRVVASAHLFAKACSQPLRVLWNRAPDFNARFDALFQTDGLPFTVVEGRTMTRPARALASLNGRWTLMRGGVVLDEAATAPGVFSFDAAVARVGRRDAFIRTNSRLIAAPGMYDIFRPANTVLATLQPLRHRLSNSVGVHVRRTDNIRAAEVSTLERFVALMKAELSTDPDAHFFVATDEPGVISALRQHCGPGVWEHPKRAYTRDDPDAIFDALVDLAGLASCRWLIGSYWSSFTDTAAEWHGIPLTVAGEGS